RHQRARGISRRPTCSRGQVGRGSYSSSPSCLSPPAFDELEEVLEAHGDRRRLPVLLADRDGPEARSCVFLGLLKGLDDRRPCADLALDMKARNDDIRGVRTVLVLESAANLGAEDLAEPPGYFPFPIMALPSGSAATHSNVSCFAFA